MTEDQRVEESSQATRPNTYHDPEVVRTSVSELQPHAMAAVAERLFAVPARWGWQEAVFPDPTPPQGINLLDPPMWVEPTTPNTNHLRRIVSAARWRLLGVVIRWLIGTTVIVIVYVKLSPSTSDFVHKSFGVAALCFTGICALDIINRFSPYYIAARNLQEFQDPFQRENRVNREAYERDVAAWQSVRQDYEQQQQRSALQRAHDDLWIPVIPSSEPTRVDIIGGDPHRHGWSGALVTIGASALAAGRRITLLDMTGDGVGSSLQDVAAARGLVTRVVRLPADGSSITLFEGLTSKQISDCLAYALTDRPETAELRTERVLARDVIRRVADCLDPPLTADRLAAGIEILRQVTARSGLLTPAEVTRLSEQVGEIGDDDRIKNRMREISHHLYDLAASVDGAQPGAPVWLVDNDLSVITTPGGRGDDKDLLDRVLTQLMQQALPTLAQHRELLILAGADQLGAATLTRLSEHARQARVPLLLLLDQHQGDLEKSLGTGGAVCFMKMYNHRDAVIAADFIGRKHTMIHTQTSRGTSTTFTRGTSTSFTASAEQGSNAQPGNFIERGTETDLNESRDHGAEGGRSHQFNQTINDNQTMARSYEYIIDPQDVLNLSETEVILIDNTRRGRRVLTIDSNPQICLRDRVSVQPAQDL